jgi:hypothetical protein
MEKEVIVALIGAVALVLVALLALIPRLKNRKAEADKLAAETKEIQRKSVEADRKMMLDALKLFDRAAFRPQNRLGDPTATFTAIRETRIALQKSGASQVSDKTIAARFQQIQDQLLQIENKVIAQFTAIADVASKVAHLPLDTSERTSQVRKALGDKYDESAVFIKGELEASYLASALQEIRERIRESDV